MNRRVSQSLVLAASLLAGCGANTVATGASPLASPSLTTLAFNAADYKATPLDAVAGLWVSGAEAGRYQVTGRLRARVAEDASAAWDAVVTDGAAEARVMWRKAFPTRGEAERWLLRMGAGSDEDVTVFFAVREAESPHDRLKLEAVRRANGNVVKL